MARRYRSRRSNNKSEGAIVIFAAIIALVIFIIKILIVLLPFLIVGFLVYKYVQWQRARLVAYDNNWGRFYQEELKYKLHIWGSTAAIGIGIIVAFIRPWVGVPISFVGLFTLPIVQQLLSQKIKGENNTWLRWTVIASLLTVSFAANGVYSEALEKENAEQAKVEKAKADELYRINKEKQARVDSANYLVQAASKYIKSKKYALAENNLQKASQIDPGNEGVYYYRGLMLQSRGKYKKALEEYDKVGTVSGLDAGELQYQKGQCYLNTGRKEEALTAFQMSGSSGFQKGGTLYEKYKPKPKRSRKVSTEAAVSASTYSYSSSSRSSGGCLAGQCIAYTKKGNRCSRRTTNCSGKCWQH